MHCLSQAASEKQTRVFFTWLSHTYTPLCLSVYLACDRLFTVWWNTPHGADWYRTQSTDSKDWSLCLTLCEGEVSSHTHRAFLLPLPPHRPLLRSVLCLGLQLSTDCSGCSNHRFPLMSSFLCVEEHHSDAAENVSAGAAPVDDEALACGRHSDQHTVPNDSTSEPTPSVPPSHSRHRHRWLSLLF